MHNTIDEYLQWVNDLPENLRKVVTDNWDFTGRLTHVNSYRKAVIQLLDMSNTFAEFSEMYKAITPTVENMSEYELNSKLGMYWDLYMSGMNRVVNDLKVGKKAA